MGSPLHSGVAHATCKEVGLLLTWSMMFSKNINNLIRNRYNIYFSLICECVNMHVHVHLHLQSTEYTLHTACT